MGLETGFLTKILALIPKIIGETRFLGLVSEVVSLFPLP